MKESLRNEVEIEDFDDEVIEGMLQFIYFRQVSTMKENALDLLRLAHQFQLTALVQECEDEIGRNLTTENATEVLEFAHLYSPTTLKPIVMSFIRR